jgi:hypothetical protein
MDARKVIVMSKQYENMNDSSDAQRQFERDHEGHSGYLPTVIDSANGLGVTRCLGCEASNGRDQVFFEQPTRATP